MKTELNGRHILVADEKQQKVIEKLRVALSLRTLQKSTQQILALLKKVESLDGSL